MITTAKEWFTKYGGIKNKATREFVMTVDGSLPTGFVYAIGKRGHIKIKQARFAGEWRRTVRRSKNIKRGRCV